MYFTYTEFEGLECEIISNERKIREKRSMDADKYWERIIIFVCVCLGQAGKLVFGLGIIYLLIYIYSLFFKDYDFILWAMDGSLSAYLGGGGKERKKKKKNCIMFFFLNICSFIDLKSKR